MQKMFTAIIKWQRNKEENVLWWILYHLIWNTLHSFSFIYFLGICPSVPILGTRGNLFSSWPLSTFSWAKTLALPFLLTMSHGLSKLVMFPGAQLGHAGVFDALCGSPLTSRRKKLVYIFPCFFWMHCPKKQSFIIPLMRQSQEVLWSVLHTQALAGWKPSFSATLCSYFCSWQCIPQWGCSTLSLILASAFWWNRAKRNVYIWLLSSEAYFNCRCSIPQDENHFWLLLLILA